MDEQKLQKELKAKTREQLLKFAQDQNIIVGPELKLKKMRIFIYEAMVAAAAQPPEKVPPEPTVGPPSDETPAPDAPPDEPPEPPAEPSEEETAAEEKAKEKQGTLYQQYLNGPLTSVQMQFLDKVAGEIQGIKTAVPPCTVAKAETIIKGWIYGLEDLI